MTTQTLTPTAQFAANVMCTALYDGIGYWADISEVIMDGDEYLSFRIHDRIMAEDDPENAVTTIIDRLAVIEATREVCTKYRDAFMVKTYIVPALAMLDSGNIDSECADMIVQVAALGGLVYG